VSHRAGRLAAACVVVLVPGCGGGTAGEDVSWAQRADGICDRAERSIRGLGVPEDVGELGGATKAASEEIRAAIGRIRALEVPDAERRRARPFLDDLALVEQHLERIASAAAAGDRRPIFKAGRRLRLDAIDLGQHAEAAGLTRCGREELGVAAADAVLAPPFAEDLARSHGTFVLGERALARRYDPRGGVRDRARYWVALWALVQRTGKGYVEPPEGEMDAIQDYWNVFHDLEDRVDFLSSIAKGEIPITSERFSEAEGREAVRTFGLAGFELLEQLGPAGEEQLRILRGAGDAEPEGQPS
jgi:hypothetical protein